MKRLLLFEKKQDPLLPQKLFFNRLLRNIIAGLLILVFFLGIGVEGYHLTCGYSWMDSLLNASMILSGMGPIGTIDNDWGKLFASLYALISGVVFITTIGLILAPVAHRVFHRFHLEEDEK